MVVLHVLERWRSPGLASYTWVSLMSLRHQTDDNGKVVAKGSKQLATGKQGTQLCAGRGMVVWLFQTVTLIQGGSWPSYWFRESLLSDSFHCQHDVFALLAGIGDSKWDSAAPEVNFSWRSHIKVAGGIPGSGRKMVIAALISVVE